MKVKRFQEGGAAPAPVEQGGAPSGQEVEQQLAQMAQQIIEQLGPEAAAILGQMIMQMLQGGGGEQAPQGQPAYQRQGGKLVFMGRR